MSWARPVARELRDLSSRVKPVGLFSRSRFALVSPNLTRPRSPSLLACCQGKLFCNIVLLLLS
eukprot:890441-Amphidinium_carterae.1